VLYLVAVADLAAAVWLLCYARVRERRNRAGVAVVGVMLVACAAVLAVIALTRPAPLVVRHPATVPASTDGTVQEVTGPVANPSG